MIGIASNASGVALIDEFESGFYYAHLPQILETICSSCEDNGVQVFGTTHSYEFLRSLLPAMSKRQGTSNEFALLRSQRQAAECIVSVVGEPSAAIENNLEVR